eukprot:383403_1
MATSFKELDDVDKRTKLMMYGFLHLCTQPKLLLLNIPDVIVNLCLLYYYVNEFWDICGQNIVRSDDKRKLIKTKNGWSNTSCGFHTISSPIYNTSIYDGDDCNFYKWDIQIIKSKQYPSYISIGLSRNFDIGQSICNTLQKWTNNICYYGHNGNQMHGSCKSIGDVYGQNDIISIELNTKNGMVSFYKNDVIQGKSWRIAISACVKYKLAVSVCDKGDSVSIMRFIKLAN